MAGTEYIGVTANVAIPVLTGCTFERGGIKQTHLKK